MKFKKVAIISKNEVSSWKSCQHITNNLFMAYREIFNTYEVFHIQVSSSFTRFEASKVAMQLRESKVELIIWLEHRPNVTRLIFELHKLYVDKKFFEKPKLIVHLFGDFILDCQDWYGVKCQLEEYPVFFYTASSKQKNLVEKLFNIKNNIGIMPFPVNSDEFNSNNIFEARKSIRQKYNLAINEKIVLYTGRISYQKNIECLLKVFNSILKLLENDTTLMLAGPWDDLLLPYAGAHGMLGSYYAHMRELLKKIDSKKIIFLGSLSTKELSILYKGADLFVSFSTHNDEDFGMSPAEAAMSGLPMVLSDWGGYSDFKITCSDTDMVPILKSDFRPSINMERARQILLAAIFKISFEVKNHESRHKFSDQYLSIQAVAKKLSNEISDLDFEELQIKSNVFDEVEMAFRVNKNAPFKCNDSSQKLSNLYKELYAAY